jgi:hypothetical protein
MIKNLGSTSFQMGNVISSVLVPETAALLIQEDLKIPRNEAVDLVHSSWEYGCCLFPSDYEEPEPISPPQVNHGPKKRLRPKTKTIIEEKPLKDNEQEAHRNAVTRTDPDAEQDDVHDDDTGPRRSKRLRL